MDAKGDQEFSEMVRAVLRREMDARKWTYSILGDALGIDRTTAERTVKGEVGLSLDRLIAIERALELPRGFLLRAAALVADPGTTREWIEMDHLLGPGERRIVLMAYDAFVAGSDE